MFIRYVLLSLLGLTAGFLIAAGTVAFITIVGVLTRLAIRTDTAKRILLYEDVVVLGAAFGNILDLFKIPIPLGTIGLIIFGLFMGCFVGCLSVALEEVIQIYPIMIHRLKLKMGIPIIVLFLAMGKGAGAIFHLFIHYKK